MEGLCDPLTWGDAKNSHYGLSMLNHGCRVEDIRDGLAVDASWTYEQVTDALQRWFPKPFERIDSRRRAKGKESPLPDWQVVRSSNRRFELVVEANFPTGETLQRFKGRSKAGPNDSHLWLGKYFKLSNVLKYL